MDEKNLDASTLAAQRQESERLARVQEQQRIIREVKFCSLYQLRTPSSHIIFLYLISDYFVLTGTKTNSY